MLSALRRRLKSSGRMVLALPLCAAVLAVSFGTGHTVTRVVQNDGGIWLGFANRVAHVNGATGTVDAVVDEEIAADGEQVVVTEDGDDVYATNFTTNTVSRIDPTAVRVDSQVRRHANPGAIALVAGGGHRYLLDRGTGVVEQLDRDLNTVQRTETGGQIGDAVVASDGTAWVLLPAKGRLERLKGGGRDAVEVGGDPAARLTLVGDRPLVVKPGSGEVVSVQEDGTVATPVEVPLEGGQEVQVSTPGSNESSAWLVVEGDEATVVRVNADGGVETRELPATGADLGDPVTLGDQLYVPDYTRREVHLLDTGSLAPAGDPVVVPGGSDDAAAAGERFEVRLHNDRVWVHDPRFRPGWMFGFDGDPREIDKDGRGPDQDDDRGDDRERPPQTTVPQTTVPPPAPTTTEPRPPTPPRTSPPDPPRVEPEPRRVPDVIGDDLDQACAVLTEEDLNCRPLAAPVGSEELEPGTVVGTEPGAGTTVAPGQLITVEYVEGPNLVPIPDLAGLEYEAACAELNAEGLICARGSALAGDVEPGLVSRTDPEAGTTVAPGQTVSIEMKHELTIVVTEEMIQRARENGDHPDDIAFLEEVYEAQQPEPEPEPAPPPTVGVPAVLGMDIYSACGAVQAAGLACANAPGKALARPLYIHTQNPPAGTAVAPGSAVQLHYDDSELAPLWRVKRLHTNVWLIGTDPARLQELLATGEYIDPATLGQAYPCCTRGVGHLASIWTFRNPNTPHRGANRYYSQNPTPRGPQWTSMGEVGQVLAQDPGGALPLHRLIKRHDGTADFTYATSPGDLDYFTSHGYVPEEVIGWVWPP